MLNQRPTAHYELIVQILEQGRSRQKQLEKLQSLYMEEKFASLVLPNNEHRILMYFEPYCSRSQLSII